MAIKKSKLTPISKVFGAEQISAHIMGQSYRDLFIEAVGGNDFVPAFMIIETEGEKYKTKLFAPDRDFIEVKDGVKIIKESYERFNI